MTSLIRRFRLSAVLACAAATFATAAASDAWAQTGNGLVSEYYGTNNFTGAIIDTRFNQGPINYTAAGGWPGGPVTGTLFTVRFRGQIETPTVASELFTFTTTNNLATDSCRLVINGTQVFSATGLTQTGTFTMAPGLKYDFMLEHTHPTGVAGLRLQWSSPSTPIADVPLNRFYSPISIPTLTLTPSVNTTFAGSQNVTMATAPIGGSTPVIRYSTAQANADPGLTQPGGTVYVTTLNFTVLTRITARAYLSGVSSGVQVITVSPNFGVATDPGGRVPGLFFREYTGSGVLTTPFPTANPPQAARQQGIVAYPTHIVIPLVNGLLPPRVSDDNNFSYSFSGYITIPSTQFWRFFTNSDDGSRLLIDGVQVVDNNFGQGTTERSGDVYLTAGLHAIQVQFSQGGGGFACDASIQSVDDLSVPKTGFNSLATLSTESMVTTPTFTPNGGGFSASQIVTLNCATPGALIYYTTDGTFPDPRLSTAAGISGSTVTLTNSATLRAVATLPGRNPSAFASAIFNKAPSITSVSAAGVDTELVVTFDKPLEPTTAQTIANYSMVPARTITGATLMTRPGALMGNWKLDDTTGADATGNSAAGTVTACTIDPAVKAPLILANAAALTFGATSTISIPYSSNVEVGASSFTVSVWIYPTNLAATRRIVNHWNNATPIGWYLDLQTNGVLYFRTRDNLTNDFTYNTGEPIVPAAQWSHIAARVDKVRNELTLFLNGQRYGAVQSYSVNHRDLTNPAVLGIGNIPSVSGNNWLGDIDDVRLYGVALTDNEVAALAAGNNSVSSAVKLTLNAATPLTAIPYTLNVANVQDLTFTAIPGAGITQNFTYLPTGTLTYERYSVGNATVADLTRTAAFPNSPAAGTTVATAEIASASLINFGGRLRGYFIPDSAGPWTFAISTQTQGKLFLSTDEDPSNKKVISYCNGATGGIHNFDNANVVPSAPITLVTGKKYYLEAYLKRDGTAAGAGTDYLSVAASTAPPIIAGAAPIAGTLLAPWVDPIVILTQPVGRVVGVGTNVTLSVTAQATMLNTTLLRYQWKKNGANIAGANATTLNFAAAALTDTASYTVEVSDGVTSGNNVTSAPAVLSVYGSPTIATVTQPAGKEAGGDTITITGTNFVTGATSVLINNVAATGINVTGPTSLTCVTPAHVPTGAVTGVSVTVTNPIASVTAAGAYTYFPPPTVTIVNLNRGPQTGVQTVTITGTNFSTVAGQTTVSFGLNAATNINVSSSTTLTCDRPPIAAGGGSSTVDVIVGTPGNQSFTLVGGYTYYPAATIISVTPNAGKEAGGDALVIMGTNFFVGFTTVKINGVDATGLSFTGTSQINCISPAHVPTGAITPVDVTIITPANSPVLPASFTYYPPPTVTVVNPPAGPLAGGQTITVSGTNFSTVAGQTSVLVGATGATGVNVLSSSSLTCVTPLGAGTVGVTVSTPGLQSFTLPTSYTYMAAPTISTVINAGTATNSGPSQGGDAVTITGTNFLTGVTTVTFAGTPAVIVNVTATTIDLLAPGHAAGPVDVTVTAPGGQITQVAAYSYVGPRILTITPAGGPPAGGQTVTITGTDFGAAPSVLFGAAAGTSVVVNGGGTSLTVVTPLHVVGPVTVTLTNGANSALAPNGYTYTNPATVLSINKPRGPVVGGQLVTITGTNFAVGNTAVSFGGVPAGSVNVTGPTTLTCLTPGHAVGTVDISVVTFANAPVTLVSSYTFVAAPVITTIVPSKGSIGGGQTVTLTGQNFESLPNTSVSIGGTTVVPVVASATQLTFMTPAHAAGAVSVTVTTFATQTSPSASYTYVDSATTVDLSLAMSVDNTTPLLNSNVTFTLTLTSSGVLNATGVSVTDLLPAGLSLVTATPSGVTTYQQGTGLWTVGGLNSGSNATLVIVAKVVSTAVITNSAEVFTCNEVDLDSTPNNNIVGEDDQASVTLSAGLTIQTAAGLLAPSTTGVPYYQQLTVTGGVPPYQWSLGSAAATFPFDLDPATGVISGVGPTAAATYTFTITASDSNAPATTASRSFTIVVSSAVGGAGPTITAIPAPPAGTVGVAYYHQFTASGGPGPYTWSVVGGTPSLPAGLFLNSATGVLAGTPTTVGGPVGFTIQATNGILSSTGFSITVNPNPVVILTATLPDAAVGAQYDQTIQASGGIGPFAWSVSSGILPPPLALTAGTGRVATITGSPSSNTPQTFTLRCNDTSLGGVAGTMTYTLNVQGGATAFAPTSAPVPPTGTINRPFSMTLTAIGGTPLYNWSVSGGSLPAGLTLNSLLGTITGTPTADGVYQITLRAQDSAGTPAIAFQTVTINIAPAPLITTASPLPSATSGQAYFTPLAVSGGAPPLTWAVSSGVLPATIGLNANSGSLSGPAGAAAVGVFDLTVTDANGATNTKTNVSLSVLNPAGALTITSGLPPAQIGVPYSATVQFTGGSPTFIFAPVGTLPPGLVFDLATGTVSGTATAAGAGTFQINVVDAFGPPGVTTAALVVNSPLAISTPSLPNGSSGAAYAASLTSTGGVVPVRWTLVSGSLPSGVTLNTSTGLISGTTGISGAATFKVQATDSTGAFVQRQFTVTVAPGGGGGPIGGGGGGGGGGGCGLLGAELLLVWLLKKRADRRKG